MITWEENEQTLRACTPCLRFSFNKVNHTAISTWNVNTGIQDSVSSVNGVWLSSWNVLCPKGSCLKEVGCTTLSLIKHFLHVTTQIIINSQHQFCRKSSSNATTLTDISTKGLYKKIGESERWFACMCCSCRLSLFTGQTKYFVCLLHAWVNTAVGQTKNVWSSGLTWQRILSKNDSILFY